MDNYRGITITPTLSKTLEHITLARVAHRLDQHPLQYGFTKSQSPVLAVLVVTEAIADALDQKKPLFILTLYVRKAFDVACQDSLLRKWHSITDSNSWAFMESNLQTSARVRLQHRYGDSFPVHQGVGQGKILSTHNYKVYINDLLLLLEASENVVIT